MSYASRDTARRDAERQEIDAWLQELTKYLEEPPRVSEGCDADTIGGDPAQADFVQIVHAHSMEVDRLRAHWARLAEMADDIVSHHPALISAMVAWDDEDCLTQTHYFSSEQEARTAANETPPGLELIFEDWLELAQEERFINLREPWIASAPGPPDEFEQPATSLDREAAAPPAPAPRTAPHFISGPWLPPEELLVSELEALMQSSPTIAAAAVISDEGVPIVTALHGTGDGGLGATSGSVLIGVSQRAYRMLGPGPLSHYSWRISRVR